MKNLLLILIGLIFLIPAFGQRNKKDVVYLHSGGIIKGQLITHDAEIVKINSEGNEWVFKNQEVDSISRFSRTKTASENNAHGYKQGFFMDASAGALIGNSSNQKHAPFSFMSSLNIRLLGNVYLGAGAGAEFLEETYMPAFGQLQCRFRDSKFTPFFNLQAGYMVPLEDARRNQIIYYDYSSFYPYPNVNTKLDAEGGYMINPSLGFEHFSSNNFGWFFAFGYRYHQLNYSGVNDYKLETNFSRLSLKIGFIFK
ncbi:MAG: hypothetical protein ACM3O8_05550 [Methylococcaceae bacterium]|nr:hypothetical protein [Prolixibacteraceae bacterium]